ncbi:hypothetical protein C6497_15605 [Candidatus Poribacteria bacterium]|nr:MAG: hypothetical protein C6497_15605 [Candidatus Poribacteria bacterium]
MRKVWSIFWIPTAILLMLCVTSVVFAQQKPTQPKDLQYIETVDLRELVDAVKDLTRNVKVLSDNQKELTDNVKELTKSVNNINTRMAVVEERTTWITAILLIILAAIFGGVVTYFFSNRRKKEKRIPTVNALDEVPKENQDERPYDTRAEDELQTEGDP